jgi:hypothetical protein
MTMRTYWCVLTQKKKPLLGKVFYDPVHEFSSALDIEVGYTVQAAFLNGMKQYAGDYANPAEYQMNVYDSQGGICRLPNFTAPADAATGPDAGTLTGYADEHLIAELARRIRQR